MTHTSTRLWREGERSYKWEIEKVSDYKVIIPWQSIKVTEYYKNILTISEKKKLIEAKREEYEHSIAEVVLIYVIVRPGPQLPLTYHLLTYGLYD